jgi:hypothetical protein
MPLVVGLRSQLYALGRRFFNSRMFQAKSMNNTRTGWLCSCLLVLVALGPASLPVDAAGGSRSAVPGQKLYRYRDERGVLVIDDSVPAHMARNGYEVLNGFGQVIEVVPRQLSEEELANLSVEEKAKREAREREEKQQLYDESLLLRYSDVVDIEAARERALKELQIRLSIVRGNMMQVKANLEREQEKAADIERSGRKVPESLRQNIDAMRTQIKLSESDIELRIRETEEIKAQYQQEIDRFRYLTEVKGYRR